MLDKLAKIAEPVFRALLAHSAEERGIFRVLMTVNVDGSPKPLLIVGNAHPRIEDGDCIAVLNPDESLQKEVTGGVAYMGHIKTIVTGRCDAMVHLWIDDYGAKKVTMIWSYKARQAAPAKLEVH